MAERRMFAKTIVLSDAFLDMPMGARCLYMTMGMVADDDGFVNAPKSIMRQISATEDDLKVLIAKHFVIPFDSGIIVIKHWRINNYLQRDRYQETKYLAEKNMLSIGTKGDYSLKEDECIHSSVYTGKDSIGKYSIDNNISISKDIDCRTDVQRIVSEWNTLSTFGISSVSKLSNTSKRYQMLIARLKEYGVDDVIKAIDNVRHSDFLQGRTKGNFIVTFDWFVKPNNFPKVLEGNYNNKPSIPEAVMTVGGDWQC